MSVSIGVGGRVKLQVYHKGVLKQETPFMKNMILDTMFKRINQPNTNDPKLPSIGGYFNCVVGTGSAAVTPTDLYLNTALGAPLPNDFIGYLPKVIGTGKVTFCTEFRFTFPESSRIGNISELGFFLYRTTNSPSLTDYLDTRVLIKDENGNPTTITLVAGDQLVVTYRVYKEVQEISTQNFVIDGVNTTCTIELCNMDTSNTDAMAEISEPNLIGASSSSQFSTLYSSVARSPTNPIGAQAVLTGGIAVTSSLKTLTRLIQPNIMTGAFSCSFATTQAQPSGGIGGLIFLKSAISSVNYLYYIIKFVPAIQKGNKKFEFVLYLNFSRL